MDSTLHVGDTCDEVHVSGDVHVPPQGHLIIKKGTTLIFKPATGIFVDGGGITAAGDAKRPILLTSQFTTQRQWKGIAIKNGDREVDRTLSHVTIEYAGSASFEDSQPGSLVIFEAANQNTAIDVSHLTVRFSQHFGVVINSPTQTGYLTCDLSQLSFLDNEKDEVYLNGGGSCISSNSRELGNLASPRIGRALIGEHGSAASESYRSDAFRYRIENDLVLNNQRLSFDSGVELEFTGGASILVTGHSEIDTSSDRPASLTGYDWGGIIVSGGGHLYLGGLRILDNARTDNNASDEPFANLKASITVIEESSLETYGTHIARNGGFGIRAEDGTELEIRYSNIQTNRGGAALAGWPAIQGFDSSNTFGHAPGADSGVIVFDTDLDATQLDLLLSANTYLIREPAVRTLSMAPGSRLVVDPQDGLEIGDGGLRLRGSPDQPIVIGSRFWGEGWSGLRLVGPNAENSVRHTVFRNGGSDGTPVLSVASGNTVNVMGTAFIENAGPGLHVEVGATVSGCSTLTFEQHYGPQMTGAPCVD